VRYIYEIIQTLILLSFSFSFSLQRTPHTEQSYAFQVHRFSVNRNADNYRSPLLHSRLAVPFLPLCHPAFTSACYFSLALAAAEKRDDVESLSKTSTSPTSVRGETKMKERKGMEQHVYLAAFIVSISLDLRSVRIRQSGKEKGKTERDKYV